MTKDNWIKAFDEKFPEYNGVGSQFPIFDYNLVNRNHVQKFIERLISQVEKDAIEKTNKRWRERIGEKAEKRLWTNTVANNMHVVKKYHQGINDLVSDLLEDKQ